MVQKLQMTTIDLTNNSLETLDAELVSELVGQKVIIQSISISGGKLNITYTVQEIIDDACGIDMGGKGCPDEGFYIGYEGISAKGMGAFATGAATTGASGDYSVAMGKGCQANGDYSVSIGENNIASTNNAVTVGNYNTVNPYKGLFSTPGNSTSALIGSNATISTENTYIMGTNNEVDISGKGTTDTNAINYKAFTSNGTSIGKKSNIIGSDNSITSMSGYLKYQIPYPSHHAVPKAEAKGYYTGPANVYGTQGAINIINGTDNIIYGSSSGNTVLGRKNEIYQYDIEASPNGAIDKGYLMKADGTYLLKGEDPTIIPVSTGTKETTIIGFANTAGEKASASQVDAISNLTNDFTKADIDSSNRNVIFGNSNKVQKNISECLLSGFNNTVEGYRYPSNTSRYNHATNLGVTNYLYGSGNTSQVYGNSYQNTLMGANNSSLVTESLCDFVDKGVGTVIVTAETGYQPYENTIVGANNKVVDTRGTSIFGYKNTATNASEISVIGAYNTIKGAVTSCYIGNGITDVGVASHDTIYFGSTKFKFKSEPTNTYGFKGGNFYLRSQ